MFVSYTFSTISFTLLSCFGWFTEFLIFDDFANVFSTAFSRWFFFVTRTGTGSLFLWNLKKSLKWQNLKLHFVFWREKIVPEVAFMYAPHHLNHFRIRLCFSWCVSVSSSGVSRRLWNRLKNINTMSSSDLPKLDNFKKIKVCTVFPHIVSEFPRKLFFFEFVNPKVTVHKGAETIQGRKLYEEIRYF